jgi:hypothetical protein
MDRLIVLEAGRIVEHGTHEELLRLGGHYDKLWRHQSGGFLANDVFEADLADDSDLEETFSDGEKHVRQ